MQLSITQRVSMDATFKCKQSELYMLHAMALRAVRDVEGAYDEATITTYYDHQDQTWPLGDLHQLTRYEDAFSWNPSYTYELTFNIPPISRADAEHLHDQFSAIQQEFD